MKKFINNQLQEKEMLNIVAGFRIRIGNWTLYDNYYDKGNRWS